MATPAVSELHIDCFWDDEFKRLNYIHEPFNDPETVSQWIHQGYTWPWTGALCDMRSPQPSWNHCFIEYFESLGWQDVGTSYYRMDTNTVMPVHADRYVGYIKRFNLQGQEHTIRRALVLLEDWAPGHYLEAAGKGYIHWRAGDTVVWANDEPHMAANIGLKPRYTLQITGHVGQ